MKLCLPTVGPIIGYTSATECRIWFRGEFQATGESSYRRCFGLLRWRKNGLRSWSKVLFNKMSPIFDMTCVLAAQPLEAERLYEYQVGWLFLDAELDRISEVRDTLFEWPDTIYSFKTASANSMRSRSYAVGSCRYLLKTFIGNIFDDRGDKTFRSILAQHLGDSRQEIAPKPLDGVVMMGDQIYADDLNFIGADTKLAEFLQRYRTVFSQENIRALMAAIPTYMILDDHEIEDNWPAKATDRDRATLYPHAIHAYQIYQCSHSPLFERDEDGRIDGVLQDFWYSFSDGCVDWFVTDSRTERVVFGPNRRMFKPEQMKALLDWLNDGSTRVKIIVTSVPLAPDLNSEEEDKWAHFYEQRTQILDAITALPDLKVVFVSGDVHCSFTSEIRHVDHAKPIAWQIVSSSFFWPYPHMQKGDFITNRPMVSNREPSPFSALITSAEVFSDDNFVRLNISPQSIVVSFYQRKGELLGESIINF